MCEQTEVQYLPDEIVWVKLHQPSLWWPGQVQDYDKLPEDITEGLKKRPIAIVKFFQEDTFEYVNNLNNIYRYNCSKKHDFIKKGLALARSQRPERPAHMDLFPQDVATAETLTHGNPDIIRDEVFAPEQKPSYEGLFGSEKKKNLKKSKSVVESILKERPSWRVKPLIAKHSSSPKSGTSPKSSKVITHPRFINKALRGETDHKVCIREQPVVEDETASPSSEYRCHSCNFVTARLNVIVLHYRSHSKSTTPIPNRAKLAKPPKPKTAKASVPKPKVETPTKSTPTEPVKKRNILKESSPAPVEKNSPKKSPKAPTPKALAPKRKSKPEIKPEVEGKKVKKEEIQELLKDWSDEEVEEESQIVGRTSDDEEVSKIDIDEPKEKVDDNKPKDKLVDADDEKKVAAEKDKVEEDERKKVKLIPPVKSKAVFDFDDDDEGLDPKLTHNTRVFGRKIPRVIDNIKERRTSFPDSPQPDEQTKPEKKVGGRKSRGVVEEEEEEEEVMDEAPEKPAEKEYEEHAERQKELESMNAEIDSLLEKTAPPDLPEIPKLNAFSMDVTDDGQIPTEKNKEEEVKDKSVLREHNNISSKRENVEDGVEVEEPPKNSLPEVGSAVEETSTPPQADSVRITAETPMKSAVIASVILKSPQSTSGGDHSYVSKKRPPISKMPPLVPTSPKSPPGKSRTYILSRSSPVKSPTRIPEDAGTVKVVSVAPTATKTAKPVPSLVKKDSKYVIVQTTQSGDMKVMPSLAPTSTTKLMTQSQTGKKLVFLTKQPSGNVVLSSQKQANILSKAPPKTSAMPKVSSPVTATVPIRQTSPQKTSGTATNVLPPKKNIVLTPSGGIRDAKTYLLPVSSVNTKSPGGSLVLPHAVKLVSSKDALGKVVLQMDSQKTKVQLPTMKRALPQLKVASKEASLAGSSLKMSSVLPSSLTTLTSPKIPKTPTAVASPKTPTAGASPKTLATPVVAKTPPNQMTNKFFHRGATSTPPKRTFVKKQTVPCKTAVVKQTVPPKTATESVTWKEGKDEAANSAPVQASLVSPEGSLEPAASMIAPMEGSVDGAAIMYILDNGTLISYDQVNQGDSEARTVFIDPASLSSSSGDLSNLIFTFDESAGNKGTLLSIAAQKGTQRSAGSTQDILAEALANTQVLQAEASASEMILDSTNIATNTIPSSSALYPNNLLTLSNNVLETSLTLNAPIMTPLEVPSAVSSLQPPPAASGSLGLPMTIAQPDITISTSAYASLPIPSATIQGTVFSNSPTVSYSTIVPVLSGDVKQTFFDVTEGGTP